MRLIDADALIQRLNEVKTGGERMGQKGIARVDSLFRLFELMTKNAPTVDAIPAVRCRDCKYRGKDGFCEGRGWPIQLVPDDGFCDKGKVKP